MTASNSFACSLFAESNCVVIAANFDAGTRPGLETERCLTIRDQVRGVGLDVTNSSELINGDTGAEDWSVSVVAAVLAEFM